MPKCVRCLLVRFPCFLGCICCVKCSKPPVRRQGRSEPLDDMCRSNTVVEEETTSLRSRVPKIEITEHVGEIKEFLELPCM